jgi:hypothetical protein
MNKMNWLWGKRVEGSAFRDASIRTKGTTHVIRKQRSHRAFTEEVLNQGRFERMSELVNEDFIELDPLAGQQQIAKATRSSRVSPGPAPTATHFSAFRPPANLSRSKAL